MGDSTANGLRFQFDTRYKIIAKRQKAMLAAGKNPSTVDIVTGGKTGQKFYHVLFKNSIYIISYPCTHIYFKHILTFPRSSKVFWLRCFYWWNQIPVCNQHQEKCRSDSQCESCWQRLQGYYIQFQWSLDSHISLRALEYMHIP